LNRISLLIYLIFLKCIHLLINLTSGLVKEKEEEEDDEEEEINN